MRRGAAPPMTDPTSWLQIIKELGFPIAISIALLLGIWLMARWIAENIAKPITTAHLSMVGTLETSQRQLADATVKQANAVDKISDTLETITITHGQKLNDIHTAVVMRPTKGGQ